MQLTEIKLGTVLAYLVNTYPQPYLGTNPPGGAFA